MGRRWKTAGLAVATAALLLWFVLYGHEELTGERPRPPAPTAPPPAPDAMAEAWHRELPERGRVPLVAWSTRTTLVLRRGDVLSGHRLSDGAQVWAKPLPPGALGLCDLSQDVNDAGVAAVVYLVRRRGCARLEAIDTTTGRPLWSAAPSGGAPRRQWGVPVVTRQLVAVLARDEDRRRSRVARLGLPDGRPLAPVRPGPGCALTWADYSTAHIAVQQSCPQRPRRLLAVHTTGTGGRLWASARHAQRRQEALVADEPLTLLQAEPYRGSETGERLLLQTYGAGGDPRRRLDDVVGDRDWAPLDNYWYADDTIVVARRNSGIAAHDLNTGTRLWRYESGDILGLIGVEQGRALIDACPRHPPPYACFTEVGLADGRSRRAGTIPEPGPRTSHPRKTFHYAHGGDLVIALQRTDDAAAVRVTAYRTLPLPK